MNLLTVPAFSDAGLIHVVVESPRGSAVKLKYEPRWNAMSLSRPLTLGVTYPFDWGFIPSTVGADGDAIDAMVLWDVASFPGVVLQCRAIGVIQVEQNRTNHDTSERVRNDRILTMPEAARREGEITTLDRLPARIRAELEQFVAIATALEGKDVRVVGWGDAELALELIARSAPAK